MNNVREKMRKHKITTLCKSVIPNWNKIKLKTILYAWTIHTYLVPSKIRSFIH